METTTEPSPARFNGLWRHPDFLRLWAGQTVSLFGSRIGGFALTFVAVLTLHASPIQVALLNAAWADSPARSTVTPSYRVTA